MNRVHETGPRPLHGELSAQGERTILEALASNPDLPIPARTRIVQELMADLTGLTLRLTERGLAPDEAERRAADALLPVGPALVELQRLARPRYRRLTESLDPRRIHRLERMALVAATLGLLVVEASALLGAGLLAEPSAYLWPVLLTGTAALAVVLAKSFQLWIKGAHRRPRQGITLIAILSVATLALGIGGAVLDLLALATTVESAPDVATAMTTAWMVRTAALLSAAIILSVAGALGWFVLSGWVTWVEQAHSRAVDPIGPVRWSDASPRSPSPPIKEIPS